MANKRVNAIVIGSGAGGGIMAKELSEAGLSVVLFERGKPFGPADFNHSELKCQCETDWPLGYGPSLKENPRTFRHSDKEEARLTYPGVDYAYGRTCSSVGGATIAWGGASWRFRPEDFRMKSTYGHVSGSTLEDWPVTYDDLEPFYEKAEYELGVSGLAGADPSAAPRKKPYPNPPLPLNLQGEILAAAGKRLGWTPFPPPFAILSQPYRGRNACIQCDWCLGQVCEVGAKSGTQITAIPFALKTGNCELRSSCFVSKILTDSKGRAAGVQYFDGQKRGLEQYADIVVVAGSATETPRLLLNSASPHHPRGLGNSSDQVGRNLMGHIYAGAFGLYERDIPHQKGPGPSIAFNEWNHPKGREIVGGGYIYNFYTTHPILFAGIRPPGEPLWGAKHKEYQRQWFHRFIWLDSNCQDMPQETNRVDLDPKVRDAWSMPVSRLTHSFMEHDYKVANFVMDKEELLLKEAGAIRVWRVHNSKGGVAEHQNGTCRLGNDPKTSVLNRYCQSHDVDNLFVTDGSCFVTSAGFNPVLTIQALAFRSADYIKKQWKGGAWRDGKA